MMRTAAELHAFVCKILETAEERGFCLTEIGYADYLEGCALVGRKPFPTNNFYSFRKQQKLTTPAKPESAEE